jgi:benzoyl-CoA reductase/2-hydroxyglutaryl-CoA dehydratase subunit BcrC/BadD/HgdB
MEAMERLSAHLRERPEQLRDFRENGGKVIGTFVGDFIPEEMIYAAGAVPVCLSHGGDRRAVDETMGKAWRFLCAFAKEQFGERLLGEQSYYNMVDMLVVPISCQNLRRAADMWAYYTDVPVFRLGVPHDNKVERSLEYYVDRLRSLKSRLEDFTSNEIEEGKLKEAIALYNRMRELLKEISLMRKAPRPPISTMEFIRLNHASFYADPVFMVDVLDSLCQELKQGEREIPGVGGPRLLLVGPLVAYGDYKILELVEEARGLIVAEELCEGVRSYWQDVEPNGDLIRALADKYFTRRHPCAFWRWSARPRFEHVMNLAQDFNVAGIIWYQIQYCESYDMEGYYFSEKMKEAGMPMIILESDYSILDRGQLKTRIEAFIEITDAEKEALS